MDVLPNYVRYRLICSIVLVLSCPVNLANSGSLQFAEKATKSYHSGYGRLYEKVCPFGFKLNWFFIISVTLSNNSSAFEFGFLCNCWPIYGLKFRVPLTWIWNHVKGVVICAIMIPLRNLYLLGPLLVCCLKSLVIDIRIYISTNPLNWWRYFLSRR